MRVARGLVVVSLAVLGAFAPLDPVQVERYYSTGLYPRIQGVLTPVSNLVPFALLDVLAVATFCIVVIVLARGVVLARRKRSWTPVLATLVRFATAGAVIYVCFLAIWGLNYRRLPMTERLVLDRAASADVLVELGHAAVGHLNALHASAHAEGWRTAPWRERRLRDSFAAVLRRLSDAAPAEPGRLKGSLLGPYFRWTSVDGMINPFGLEAIANPDLLPFERPMVAAHEWAHLAGYADESEASFVGVLTCIRAATPAAYSGWLYLYWQISAEVGSADRRRLAAILQEGPRQDVNAIAERLRRGQIALLRDAGWRVYDQYLKANRVEEGVRSYDLVLTLLAQARFEDGWLPVRRQSAVR
jgi:hypothetical protein